MSRRKANGATDEAKKERAGKPVNIRLTDESFRRLRLICHENGTNASEIVEGLVNSHIDKEWPNFLSRVNTPHAAQTTSEDE